jgi:hypothetical protein
MAHDAIAFLTAMGFGRAGILGYSIGSFVAQDIAPIRPDLVRRLILASSAPRGAAGMHGWTPEVIGAVGAPDTSPAGYLQVFFTRTASSREAGQDVLQRIYGRTEDRDKPTTWATRQAQYDAVCVWRIPDHGLLQRLSGIGQPVLVANGDSDPIIRCRHRNLPGQTGLAQFRALWCGREAIAAGVPWQRGCSRKPSGATSGSSCEGSLVRSVIFASLPGPAFSAHRTSWAYIKALEGGRARRRRDDHHTGLRPLPGPADAIGARGRSQGDGKSWPEPAHARPSAGDRFCGAPVVRITRIR